MANRDPWDWTQQSPQASPLSGANIQPSQATPPQINAAPPPGIVGTIAPLVEARVIGKGLDKAEKGIASFKFDPNSTTGGLGKASGLVGGNSAEVAAAIPATDAVVVPVANYAGPLASYGGQTTAGGALVEGAGVLAPEAAAMSIAPEAIAAGIAPEAIMGAQAASTAGLASAAPLAAGGAAAEAGTMAALASNPVGWAIAAGLLAKQLKIF